MKTLVIAEKPSVAQDIVRAMTPTAGKFEKHDEYFEADDWVVTSAVGHLVEIHASAAAISGASTTSRKARCASGLALAGTRLGRFQTKPSRPNSLAMACAV